MTYIKTFTIVLFYLAVTACGGGGGSDEAPVTNVTPTQVNTASLTADPHHTFSTSNIYSINVGNSSSEPVTLSVYQGIDSSTKSLLTRKTIPANASGIDVSVSVNSGESELLFSWSRYEDIEQFSETLSESVDQIYLTFDGF